MELNTVTTKKEIKCNLALFDDYLSNGSSEEKEFVHGLIQRGKIFIAYKTETGFSFAPSRYIGYSANTMERHDSDLDKDGKVTTPAINEVMGFESAENTTLEVEYLEFIKKLDIKRHENKRKYWEFD